VAASGLERMYTQAREEGIIFFRFDQGHPNFQVTNQGLEMSFQDEILGRSLTLQPHLLIVDEMLQPHPDLKPLSEILGISLDGAGFMAPDQIYALPVRTPRKGIFAVGGSRRPVTDDEDSLSEVQEALLLTAELIGKGIREVEAPRVEIDRKKCTICLTCVRSCPHQALSFLYRRPQISALACQVCGICAAECPMDAIQIKNYRDQTITAEVSTFFTERKYDTMAPQVVVFCCRNSAEKTLQQALLYKEPLPIGFEFIQVPCAGKIDPDYLLHALQEGADGVLILACHIDGCQSFEGNKMALERIQFLKEVITETGLEADRLQFQTIAPGMVPQFLQICYQMEDRFRKLGISPVRRSLGIQRIYEKFTFPVDSKAFTLI
jgi:quinone-modifying oxidoreductase, subunit QmoB